MNQSFSVPAGRGAIDLSALGVPSTTGTALEVVEVTELNLQSLAELSLTKPVFLLLCSRLAPGCSDFRKRFEKVAGEYADKIAVGVADTDEQPGISAALQVTAVPAMFALVGGRPAPLFQGAPDDEQLRSVIDQVLEIAVQAGLPGGDGAQQAGDEEPAAEPLPPLHQAAYDAIERGDYEAAVAAYDQALKENPKDGDARAGRAQVLLLVRSGDADLGAVRARAANAPEDVDAQLAVADIDVLGGQVEDAFARLIDAVRSASPEDKDRIRLRLVELFEVVGLTDPRVIQARQALASALY